MKRSVRNGIAIAGMAGGMWFLGQAVAQADEQVNTTGQENVQTATGEDGSGVTGNVGDNANDSSNTTTADVSTNADGGNGGDNASNVTTGAQGATIIVVADDEEEAKVLAELQGESGGGGHGEDATGVVNVETESVSVEQNANGGSVDGSGNISELPTLPNQTNNVSQTNNQSATSEDDHGRPHDGDWDEHDSHGTEQGSFSGGHDDGVTGNTGGNSNESSNNTDIDVSTNVSGGNGGTNTSNVNTGLQDVVFQCIAIGGGDAKCVFNISTGSVTVVQNANGGNVTNSGNIGSGAKEDGSGGKEDEGAKPSCPCPKHAMPQGTASGSAPGSGLNVTAQPSGQLAYTGSDVSAPLTAGLLALMAGGALTLLGRRPAITA